MGFRNAATTTPIAGTSMSWTRPARAALIVTIFVRFPGCDGIGQLISTDDSSNATARQPALPPPPKD